MTPHLNANIGDFAKTVLMPGDPFRASYISQHFLSKPHVVNKVRANYGYTGEYNGKPISVIASGMGQPSLAIYATELFTVYGVENIIRVGTAGALHETINIGDIIIGVDSFDDLENYSVASDTLIDKFINKSITNKDPIFSKVAMGTILATNFFYDDEDLVERNYTNKIAIDMETFMLYYLARKYEQNAITVNLISDSVVNHNLTALTVEERTTKTYDMIKMVLDVVTND